MNLRLIETKLFMLFGKMILKVVLMRSRSFTKSLASDFVPDDHFSHKNREWDFPVIPEQADLSQNTAVALYYIPL